MNALFYYLLQWTWGILQNIAGLLVYLLCSNRPKFRYHHAAVVLWNKAASMGLGMFIFVGRDAVYGPGKETVSERILYHEYGHTIQSVILGPFFLPLIAIPSLIWSNSRRLYRFRNDRGYSYYSFYPEKWADQLGLRFTRINRQEDPER